MQKKVETLSFKQRVLITVIVTLLAAAASKFSEKSDSQTPPHFAHSAVARAGER